MSEDQNGKRNHMKQYQIMIIVIAVLIIVGVAAFFIVRGTQAAKPEETLPTVAPGNAGNVTEAVPETVFQIGLDDVVATVKGQEVKGAEVLEKYEQVVNYYGKPDADSLELYYAVAMEEAITLKLVDITAAEMGLDQFTQEELDALYATADSEWQYALDNYVNNTFTFTGETTDEEKAEAYAEAEAYFGQMGYDKDILRQNYVDNEVFTRVNEALCKDVTVTDEEVLAYYDEAVQADKEIYEFDIDAYENQVMMKQYGYSDAVPWYKPEGYRYVKHILLEVDQTLMDTYTDLVARYEEQMDATVDEAAEDATADTEAVEAAVTAADVDAAKAAIIASVQDTIDEINAKLAEGASFEDLIAEYGTDPGMTSGSYPDGYEVSLASYGFVQDFVSAAFSVDAIGDVSQPVVSDYGVHIVKYMADVPAGPIELTDELKATITTNLKDQKCAVVLNDWSASANITYTGIIRPVKDIQADEAEAGDVEAE